MSIRISGCTECKSAAININQTRKSGCTIRFIAALDFIMLRRFAKASHCESTYLSVVHLHWLSPQSCRCRMEFPKSHSLVPYRAELCG